MWLCVGHKNVIQCQISLQKERYFSFLTSAVQAHRTPDILQKTLMYSSIRTDFYQRNCLVLWVFIVFSDCLYISQKHSDVRYHWSVFLSVHPASHCVGRSHGFWEISLILLTTAGQGRRGSWFTQELKKKVIMLQWLWMLAHCELNFELSCQYNLKTVIFFVIIKLKGVHDGVDWNWSQV